MQAMDHKSHEVPCGAVSPIDCIDLSAADHADELKRRRALEQQLQEERRLRRQAHAQQRSFPSENLGPSKRRRRPSTSESVLTASEFGEVDRSGRARLKTAASRARDVLSSSFNGLLIMIPGLNANQAQFQGGGGHLSQQGNNRAMQNVEVGHHGGQVQGNGHGRWSGDRADDAYSEDSYEGKRRKRGGTSCCMILLLLLLDFFTIALVLMMFSHLQDNACEFCNGLPISRKDPDSSFPFQFVATKTLISVEATFPTTIH